MTFSPPAGCIEGRYPATQFLRRCAHFLPTNPCTCLRRCQIHTRTIIAREPWTLRVRGALLAIFLVCTVLGALARAAYTHCTRLTACTCVTVLGLFPGARDPIMALQRRFKCARRASKEKLVTIQSPLLVLKVPNARAFCMQKWPTHQRSKKQSDNELQHLRERTHARERV